jgi:hypothetical protein
MSRTDFSFTINNALLRGVALRGAAFGVLAAVITQPVLAADASNGERLAMRWCAACHVVANDQREANTDAPPFEAFAKRPNFSEFGLMTFLINPREDAKHESDTFRGGRHRGLRQQAKVGIWVKAKSVGIGFMDFFSNV